MRRIIYKGKEKIFCPECGGEVFGLFEGYYVEKWEVDQFGKLSNPETIEVLYYSSEYPGSGVELTCKCGNANKYYDIRGWKEPKIQVIRRG